MTNLTMIQYLDGDLEFRSKKFFVFRTAQKTHNVINVVLI